MLGGFQIANIDFADTANAFTITNWTDGYSLAGYSGLVYWPEPIEFGVSLGVIALGALFLLLGLRYLPLRQAKRVSE